MKTVAVLCLLAACATSDTESGPQASLQINFGLDPTRTLSTAATSGTTDSRLMLRAVKGNTTLFVSLQWPSTASVIELGPTQTQAQVWAQLGKEAPRVAIQGRIELTVVDGILSASIHDAGKPDDAAGGSMLVSGSITGVKL